MDTGFSKMKICKQCETTGEDLKNTTWDDEMNKLFRHGFIISVTDEDTICPFCGSDLEITNMTFNDFQTIRDASNYNRQLLEAMIELNKKDIIEYELKMSQFRNQAQQQKTIEEQKVSDSTPKCPHCHSTKIKPISGTERAASVLGLGILSKKLNKSFKCLNCKYMW